jgi:transcriptional regulator with XRE-family HTH domain
VARPTPQVIVGRNIAFLRAERSMTQEDLADRADLHAVLVSRVERGATDPRLSTLVKIARGLRVAPADLLNGLAPRRK